MRNSYTLSRCLRLCTETHSKVWAFPELERKVSLARLSESRWAVRSTASLDELRQLFGKFWITSSSKLDSSRNRTFATCVFKQSQDAGFFYFHHRRPCFATLDHIWKEIVQFHDWHPISTTSTDELLSCICMVPLIDTDMRAPLSNHVFWTDASEFGAGACETIDLTTAGVTTDRGEVVQAANSSSRETSTGIAVKTLVLGLLRRARPQRHSWAYRFAAVLSTRRVTSNPNLPAFMALESHFEISVEKKRSTHQWTGISGPVHTASICSSPVTKLKCASPCLWTV